ncbi:protein regulator of cytokinesis 1a isoform X3 [Electrophorus electricus]|uniref:protein regulator of cytokinesis 1a isoform X3 n=1 Tax=Electrophorus electricus TaxID=8005 RepID=UPI000F09ABEB|nr:protein regulator of cytokinesis 1a isoform X3 [Electrophorus electricus]
MRLPFYSEVHAAESVACLNKALSRLKDIWEEIGIPEDQRLQRTDAVKMHIKNLLDMMIAEEEGLKKRLLSSIGSCRKELSGLCEELGLPPFEDEEGLTMLQLEKEIRTRLKVMLKQKSQRMSELKTLMQQDRELCDVLCDNPYTIDPDRVPSAQQLEDYRQHIATRNKEKECRHAEFVTIKRQIVACMEDLEQMPDTSFEREVVCEDEEAFCLSTENITALKVLLSQLENQKARIETMCVSYRCRIGELWERLHVPQEERETITEHITSSRKRDMDALQTELERLEELKMKNIKSVVEIVRGEISLLWEKCFYSLQQRQAFTPYYDDAFTEELLAAHEQEQQCLKEHYESHRELYDGVNSWQNNWSLFQELEKKATDPSRFHNRGGNLLREEKQRAELQKSLPKLERSLKSQIEQWEAEQGKEFQVNGQCFTQYVEEQWNLHHLEKEREKLERQMKKSKQTEEDMLYGTALRTPTKRRLAGTPTPGKARKLNTTSSIASFTPNSTLRSICHSPSMRPPLSVTKVTAGCRTPARGRTPRGLERNKENLSQLSGALRTMTASPHRNYSINSVASSYSEFARELSQASKSSCKTGLLNSTITR